MLLSVHTAFATGVGQTGEKVKKIHFGKYDEYAYVVYEQTNKFPKTDNQILAVTVEINDLIQCDYKFVFTMPESADSMLIWYAGEWDRLGQGEQHSYAINTKSATHRLRDNIYSIRGSFAAGEKGGFIRALLKGESLTIGQYDLKIYIDGKLIRSIEFNVYPPLSKELGE